MQNQPDTYSVDRMRLNEGEVNDFATQILTVLEIRYLYSEQD